MNFDSPFLYPILDENRSVDLEHDAREVIRAGANILQLRAKKLSNRNLFKIVNNLLPHCTEAGVLLIVNDRVDVCIASAASGVHLGQYDFPVKEARRLMPDRFIGISTHNADQVRIAHDLPVNYISIGPVFATASKTNPDPVVGTSLLKQARSLTNKPIVCIGGIHEADIPDLVSAGSNGIAVISEIYSGKDIFCNMKRLLELIGSSQHNDTKAQSFTNNKKK